VESTVNEATLTLTGNVATPIRFARSEKGTAVATFRLACTPRHFDKPTNRWVDERTNFLTVVCFRALAENVATSLTKGDPVVVTGKLRVQEWERDERNGLNVEVDAAAIGHDLNRGQTRFARIRKEVTSNEHRDPRTDSAAPAHDGDGVTPDADAGEESPGPVAA